MSTKPLPRWYAILKSWRDNPPPDKNGDGLSFSFIVGATREPPGARFADSNEAKQYSRALYNEMMNDPEYLVNVIGCEDDVGYDVLKIEDKGAKCNQSSFKALWNDYGVAISDGQFSCWHATFSEFSSKDKEWIAKAISGN
jgi:hypothetical protein